MGDLTQQRLEQVRRVLSTLTGHGWTRVTSRDLARWLGASAETIRRDLMELGPGRPGAAYEVAELRSRLDERLGPLPPRCAALAGLGNLGRGLAASPPESLGWPFTVGFDPSPNRLETVEVPFPVFPTTEIVPVCHRLGIDSAVLCLEAVNVQRAAERFIQAGVRLLVNYSPVVLRVNRNQIEVWERGFLL